jgi:hypothetical protein
LSNESEEEEHAEQTMAMKAATAVALNFLVHKIKLMLRRAHLSLCALFPELAQGKQ